MYVTSVTLTRSILCDPTNPTVQIACGTGSLGSGSSQRLTNGSADGEFRVYAGDRTRLVTYRTTARGLPVVLKGLTAAQRYLVECAWLGIMLLFRDTYGNKIFGGYLQFQTLDLPRSSQGAVCDIAVTLQRVTYSEAV